MNPDSSDQARKGHNAAITAAMSPAQRGEVSSNDRPRLEPLRVGSVLYGYCGGEFGRDSYDEKRVEAIGVDWVVCRENGKPVVALCRPDELEQYSVEEAE